MTTVQKVKDGIYIMQHFVPTFHSQTKTQQEHSYKYQQMKAVKRYILTTLWFNYFCMIAHLNRCLYTCHKYVNEYTNKLINESTKAELYNEKIQRSDTSWTKLNGIYLIDLLKKLIEESATCTYMRTGICWAGSYRQGRSLVMDTSGTHSQC